MDKKNPSTTHTISDPDTWVEKHGDYLYRNALARVRDTGVAGDIVQETFLAALKARDSFAGRSTEQTWLIGILKRKIADHFRQVSRESDPDKFEHLLTDIGDDFETAGDRAGWWKNDRRPAKWMIDIHDSAEQREFWEFLQQCLDTLHPRLAVMFVLREMEELDSEKICNVLSLTPTNLRVMLHRARKDLRGCLEKNWMGTQK
jgi:RNA polymerase sigma-70 factor (ECF subfamily)